MKRTFILAFLFLPLLVFSETLTILDGPLVREATNKVAFFQLSPRTPIESITFELTHLTEASEIDSFSLYQTNNHLDIKERNKIAHQPLKFDSTPQKDSLSINFNLTPNFKTTLIYPNIVLTIQFKPSANLLTTFKIKSAKIRTNQTSVQFTAQDSVDELPLFRVGTILRKRGDEGYPGFRIPGMITTKKNTIIAVYDARNVKTVADLPNDIDIAMSRSTDGGITWEPMKIIMDLGDEDIRDYKGNGIGDPSILYDPITDTIWVAATWSHGNRAWWGSGKGLEPSETGQLLLCKSVDDGLTWSEPINITKQVKDPGWHYLLQGPGIGISTTDGTLVFPAQYQDETEDRTPFSTIMYSQDHGENWTIVKGPRGMTTESQVVELSDGSLMLNCRDDRNRSGERVFTGGRAIYTTSNFGNDWIQHPTSDFTLPEPNCQASLIKLPIAGDNGKFSLAFFNPNAHRKMGVDGGKADRSNFALQISYDDGMTWEKKIVFDPNSGRGYSTMCIEGENLCILYEGSKGDLFFQKIPLHELKK